jgi:DNA-directed RNA polymerase subunit M/transcription elongation factor TFIIS
MKFVKDQKKPCRECGDHRALFRIRGTVKRDARHTLCFRCYHSFCDSWRARRLAELRA